MIRVALIGTGNLGNQLFHNCIENPLIELVQLYGRNTKEIVKLKATNKKDNDWETTKKIDIYIIAVSDDAIASVAEQYKDVDSLLVHTSGSVPIDYIPSNRRGSFYPVQTFSKTRKVNFKDIPIGVEAANEKDFILLQKLARAMSNQVFEISSAQRKQLHLAAVFVNNFTNHLYHIGNEICKENKIPFEILKPLIIETAKKITVNDPLLMQTGPAKRNDNETIKNQLAQLKGTSYRDIYTVLTKSIQDTYGNKL